MTRRTAAGPTGKKFTPGGTPGVIASVATILPFLIAVGHSSPTQPHPGQTSPAFSRSPTGSSDPTGRPPRAGSAYRASAEQHPEQLRGDHRCPHSYCQCNLCWLKANIPYSMFVQDPATFEQQADSYAGMLMPGRGHALRSIWSASDAKVRLHGCRFVDRL